MASMDRDPRGRPATERLNYTAYRLARALNRAAENTALAHGVTLPQLLILQVLGEGEPLSNAQVARRTFVSSQAAHVVSAEAPGERPHRACRTSHEQTSPAGAAERGRMARPP
ncbi:helix-turn-helix domain-containing protein [Microbacterium sp. ET2]|uniref:MarR family transcriptional regulator n=1 Tax=Microbacterium albipurpureum TaxID=3050384 RepID=UPI00259C90F3|nr:helix-turn-helix domain-containing protein [Microbacterium sp. ET2 (Ac-2212)]WJL94414.1 helix-turn-helix domain-containing protein [Microbacterium sp. ET2 (Ac-2212)]